MPVCFICNAGGGDTLHYRGVAVHSHVSCISRLGLRAFDQIFRHYLNHANTARNEPMSSIRKRKLQFASLPIIQALATVKVGWELETQAVDGKEYDECVEEIEPEFDEERFYDDVAHHVSIFCNNIGFYPLLRRAKGHDPLHSYFNGLSTRRVLDKLMDIYNTCMQSNEWRDETVNPRNVRMKWYNWVRANRHLSLADMEQYGANLDDIKAWLTEFYEEDLDRSEYYTTPDEGGAFCLEGIPSGVEAKYDSSVSGPEFIIEGRGTTVSRAVNLLDTMFRQFDMDIDEGCSFHVHVSVPGIIHSYGPNLQMYMYEYLLSQVHRVPKSVRTRWERNTNYFRPILQEHKYTFIRFHCRYRTWEFRCFGNITNVKDGALCIKLAVEALQYAYQVQLGLRTAILKDSRDWTPDIYNNVISDKYTSINKELRKIRIQRRKQEEQAA